MKPIDDQENSEKCICRSCPVHEECNGKKESLFCSCGRSQCGMNRDRICSCKSCLVYKENDLEGGYFCINEFE